MTSNAILHTPSARSLRSMKPCTTTMTTARALEQILTHHATLALIDTPRPLFWIIKAGR